MTSGRIAEKFIGIIGDSALIVTVTFASIWSLIVVVSQ
jgi:hypothetical protein